MATAQVYIVAMPRLSDAMSTGYIAQWLIGDGEPVSRGQAIVEIETDKATMAYEAEAGGWLRILAPAGTQLALGEPIAEIHPAPPSPSDAARPDSAPERPRDGGISPLARRIAQRIGVDVTRVSGTGPHGRVLKRDVVDAAAAGAAPAAAPAPTEDPDRTIAAPAPPRDPSTVVPFTRLQHVTADRLSKARAEIPEFTLTTEIDMDAALALRAQLQSIHDPPPSVNDFIVRACALALRAHPRVNSAWRDGAVEMFDDVNVGIAVAADEELFVTRVARADTLSLSAIAVESRRLTQAVREGSATADDLAATTFTISNLGMYGVHAFEAIINPPNAAILAVGAIRREPRYDEHDQLVPARVMTITLACDHRIVYGAAAAVFLADVKRSLEEPLRLVTT